MYPPAVSVSVSCLSVSLSVSLFVWLGVWAPACVSPWMRHTHGRCMQKFNWASAARYEVNAVFRTPELPTEIVKTGSYGVCRPRICECCYSLVQGELFSLPVVRELAVHWHWAPKEGTKRGPQKRWSQSSTTVLIVLAFCSTVNVVQGHSLG